MTTTRIWIDVTDSDLKKGIKNNSAKCMIAQALARTRKTATNIVVDTQMIRFTEGEQRVFYLTPYAAQQYVVAFDAGDEIRPFRFQLRDPIKVKRARLTPAGKARMREYNREKKAGLASQGMRKRGDEQLVLITKEGVRSPPNVWRKRARAYGMRALRVNRDDVSPK